MKWMLIWIQAIEPQAYIHQTNLHFDSVEQCHIAGAKAWGEFIESMAALSVKSKDSDAEIKFELSDDSLNSLQASHSFTCVPSNPKTN